MSSNAPRGPVPKHSSERRRRNKDGGEIENAQSGTDLPTPPPDASPDWHPIAIQWFESLAKSGQAIFYEPSDWMTAFYIAEAMSRNCDDDRMSGHMFGAVMAASERLLVTEGDRRRLRLELTRAKVEDTESAGVIALRDYKKSIGG